MKKQRSLLLKSGNYFHAFVLVADLVSTKIKGMAFYHPFFLLS